MVRCDALDVMTDPHRVDAVVRYWHGLFRVAVLGGGWKFVFHQQLVHGVGRGGGREGGSTLNSFDPGVVVC